MRLATYYGKERLESSNWCAKPGRMRGFAGIDYTVAQTCLAPIGDIARVPNGSLSEPAVKGTHRETHSAAHP